MQQHTLKSDMDVTFDMSKKDQATLKKELGRKNIRLAIILGLVAISFYAGFFLFYAT